MKLNDNVIEFGLYNSAKFDQPKTAKEVAAKLEQHDKLTAINQELVEALENTLGSLGDEFALCGYVIDDIEKAIKRAKELTNEG